MGPKLTRRLSNISIFHFVTHDPLSPRSKITVQWDLKQNQILNRNLDTHQNTLPCVTKCYCPEAGKLIKREYICHQRTETYPFILRQYLLSGNISRCFFQAVQLELLLYTEIQGHID